MPIYLPPIKEEILIFFIQHTNKLENIDVQTSEIITTLHKKTLNPFAAGNIAAIAFAMKKLSPDTNFPAKHPSQCQNPQESDKNLYWLKEINKKILDPIFVYKELLQTHLFQNPFDQGDCGNYRLIDRAFQQGYRPLPKPNAVPELMHLWYKELCLFHLKIATLISSPARMTLNDWEMIDNKAFTFHLMLQCIHPFRDGTGRTARIVENALRLRWGLPWKTIKSEEKLDYVKSIQKYEDGPEWKEFKSQC